MHKLLLLRSCFQPGEFVASWYRREGTWKEIQSQFYIQRRWYRITAQIAVCPFVFTTWEWVLRSSCVDIEWWAWTDERACAPNLTCFYSYFLLVLWFPSFIPCSQEVPWPWTISATHSMSVFCPQSMISFWSFKWDTFPSSLSCKTSKIGAIRCPPWLSNQWSTSNNGEVCQVSSE